MHIHTFSFTSPRISFLLSVIVLSLFLILISPVYAEDVIDISDAPQGIADALGLSLFAGQIIASGLVVSMFIIPTIYATNNEYAILIMGCMPLFICLAIGWLPFGVLLVILLFIALMYAGKVRSWISGKV